MHTKSGTAGIWLVVLSIGLTSVLTRSVLSGENAALAKTLVLRLAEGDLSAAGMHELVALLLFGIVLVFEPLAVIGALLLLEFRFSPAAEAKDYRLAWAVQTLFMTGASVVIMAIGVLDPYPEPVWRFEAGSPADAILRVVPAFVLLLFLYDFLDYWTHRALHHFGWLWRFHSVHHSQDLDVLHNIAHPVDRIAMFLGVTVPAGLLLGVSHNQLYLLVAFTSLQTHFNHTRLPIHMGPLRLILCDNRYHFVHHSRDARHHGTNYANRFPILDRIFGTYQEPPAILMETGLADRTAPASLRDYLAGRLPPRREPEVAPVRTARAACPASATSP